jgi:leucyl/phenylalanyl-tRNA--protein transferase
VTRRRPEEQQLSPALLLRAYAIGIFPMARSREARTVHWVAPAQRGVLPLDAVHVPRRLKKVIRQRRFDVRCDTAFADVIEGCATPRPGHPETWISRDIARVFCDLHTLGFAHSIESWCDGRLVGGLYGLALGSAFFGESMFSYQSEASKVALIHLTARLRAGGFTLLDTQFITPHLTQFGAIEIPSPVYLALLDEALKRRASFQGRPDSVEDALAALLAQSSTQMS